MNTSLLKNIVIPAWQMVLQFSSIKKMNFFPSLISTLWLFCLLAYQIVYSYVHFLHKTDQLYSNIGNFVKTSYFTESIILLGIIFVSYMVIVPIAEGAVLEMIHSYRSSEGSRAYRGFQGFILGLKHFLRLFELHNMLGVFKPLSIITFTIFLIRMMGVHYLSAILMAMGGYMFIALIVNTLFAYARFFVVFQDKSALESLSASTFMSINHIHITVRLYFTLLLVYMRTILIALIFLFLPFFMSTILALITATFLKVLFIAIMSALTIIFLIFVTHLNSVLEIFVEGMWYEAYMQNIRDESNPEEATKSHETYDTHQKNYLPSYSV